MTEVASACISIIVSKVGQTQTFKVEVKSILRMFPAHVVVVSTVGILIDNACVFVHFRT